MHEAGPRLSWLHQVPTQVQLLSYVRDCILPALGEATGETMTDDLVKRLYALLSEDMPDAVRMGLVEAVEEIERLTKRCEYLHDVLREAAVSEFDGWLECALCTESCRAHELLRHAPHCLATPKDPT